MAETINLGIVGIKNMGEYNSQTNYEKLNVVTYQGSTYCALQETKGNLPTNIDYWQLYAQKGEQGPTGATGEDGHTPEKGTDYFTTSDISDLEATLSSDVHDEVSEQLGSLTSATPLTASSTSEMTDTTRIYVNTTDGYWYYYNGTNWTQGGVYQSTGINVNSVSSPMTTFFESLNMLPLSGWISGKIFDTDGSESSSNGSLNETYVSVEEGTIVSIQNANLNLRSLYVCTYDTNKTFIERKALNAFQNPVLSISSTVKYVRFCFIGANALFNLLPDNSPCVMYQSEMFKLLSYKQLYKLSDKNNNVITTDNIGINDIKVKILPRVYQGQLSLTIGNINYENTYTGYVRASRTSANAAFLGFYLYADEDEVSAGDKLILNTTGSSAISSITLKKDSNIYSFINKGNGIYELVLTNAIISDLNSGDAYFYTNLGTGTQSSYVYLNVIAYINNLPTNLTTVINDIKEKTDSIKVEKKAKIITMGDSITALTGTRSWFKYFNEIISSELIANVAASGARIPDFEDTVYDGDPKFANPSSLVIGNEVQKIINNEYDAPDFIIIAIGTNYGIPCTPEQMYNAYYDTNGDLIPLADVNRKTVAGAFRYTNEKLHEIYPNAKIFWCTPIQGANAIRNTNTIISWGNNLKMMCQYASVYCIDTEKCGIVSSGEVADAEGEYLLDGLHPKANGAKLIGEYNASEFLGFYNAFNRQQ